MRNLNRRMFLLTMQTLWKEQQHPWNQIPELGQLEENAPAANATKDILPG